jgi:hypothetical protein
MGMRCIKCQNKYLQTSDVYKNIKFLLLSIVFPAADLMQNTWNLDSKSFF